MEYLVALEEGRDTREGATARPTAPGSSSSEMMEVQEALEEAKAAGMDEQARPAPGGAGAPARSGSARRRTPSWAGPPIGTRPWARAPIAGRCSSGSRQRLAARAYLRTVIDDLSEALGEDLESHVSHRRH